MQNKKIIRRKILLLGAYAVGKTSLTQQFVEGTFTQEYLSTIGVNIKHKTIESDDFILNLLIWDIADIVTHQNIPDSYLQGADGLMLVYDLSRVNTYKRITAEYQGFLLKNHKMPTIVVGNKTDLEVDPEQGDMIDELTNIKTSAKTGDNVDQAFQLLIDKFMFKNALEGNQLS